MPENIERMLEKAALNSRGWVVQERLLSRANLHFSRLQLYLECSGGLFCEAVPDQSLPGSIPKVIVSEVKNAIFRARLNKDARPSEPASAQVLGQPKIWQHALSLYSGCVLTRPVDRLIAVGGLAKLLAESGGGTYLAGLWQDVLLPSYVG
jgi:hypothetical protein